MEPPPVFVPVKGITVNNTNFTLPPCSHSSENVHIYPAKRNYAVDNDKNNKKGMAKKPNAPRGRPRLTASRESLIDRRRKQLRDAQRVYRDRKEQAIKGLEQKLERLEEMNLKIIHAFSIFADTLQSHGAAETSQYFRDMTSQLLTDSGLSGSDHEGNDVLSSCVRGNRLDAIQEQHFSSMRPMLRAETGASSDHHTVSTAAQAYPAERRPMHAIEAGEDSEGMQQRSARKRQKPRHGDHENDDMPLSKMHKRRIHIQNSKALRNFYDQRFKSCQQLACTLIAKAWVKAVEPKKQSAHPYTGSDCKAPDWWPKPWGNTKEDKVRHKGPDHLSKRERVHLLNHILSLVIEPIATQHRDIRKLQLSVKKLEECANQVLSGFFAESSVNHDKKRFLDEIFKVAKQEERYRNGEIDGAVEVCILDADKTPDDRISENGAGSFSQDEDEPRTSPSVRSGTTQGLFQTPVGGHSVGSQQSLFLDELSKPPHPVLHDMGTMHHEFYEGGLATNSAGGVNASRPRMGVNMTSSPQDAIRRPPIYSNYSSANPRIYAEHWQTGTAELNEQSLYTQQNNQQAQAFAQTVPVTHTSVRVPSTFVDSFPCQGYNPRRNHIFWVDGATEGSLAQTQSYDYIASYDLGMQALTGVSSELGT